MVAAQRGGGGVTRAISELVDRLDSTVANPLTHSPEPCDLCELLREASAGLVSMQKQLQAVEVQRDFYKLQAEIVLAEIDKLAAGWRQGGQA